MMIVIHTSFTHPTATDSILRARRFRLGLRTGSLRIRVVAKVRVAVKAVFVLRTLLELLLFAFQLKVRSVVVGLSLVLHFVLRVCKFFGLFHTNFLYKLLRTYKTSW